MTNEDTFELNTEGKKLEHITKNRPKRDRNKKPTKGNASNQQIETVELNEDLIVAEKPDEQSIATGVSQTNIVQPVPTISTPTVTIATTISNSEAVLPATPKTPIIPKSNAEQPKVSIDALDRIRLRKMVKIPNESKDAESTITSATDTPEHTQALPGMLKANKFRYSCYAGSTTGKSPASLGLSQVNTIAEDEAPTTNELVRPLVNKIAPVKPPKPPAPPKPSLTPVHTTSQQDTTHAEQAPTPFVRLRPVKPLAPAQADSPATAQPSSTANSENTNKTEQDKRQSLTVKERIQYLSEESKV